jgi:hypothetical protein
MLNTKFLLVASLAIVTLVDAKAMSENLMKFMKSDLVDYPNKTDTSKTNVTLWEDGENTMVFEYYIRRLVNDNGTAECKEKLQFHGNCYFWGVSVEQWDTLKGNANANGHGDDSFAMCQFALSTATSKIKDWGGVKMTYVGQGLNDKNTWECIEGFSELTATKYTPDTYKKFNCMANSEKSTSTFAGTAGGADNKAYLIGHFMREFDAKVVFPENDDKEDIAIKNDDTLKIDLLFAFSGQDDKTKKYEIKGPLGPKEGLSCSSSAMNLKSLLSITALTSLFLSMSTFI